MIKIENQEVLGFEHAIRGMRNPMNSWDKSDSGWIDFEDWDCGHGIPDGMGNAYIIGNNDLDLMTRLAKAGTDHRKFMRMMVVYADVTAPLYWWKEYDTYKVGTVANSCSTMHKIHDKEFTMEDFSYEHLLSLDDNGAAFDYDIPIPNPNNSNELIHGYMRTAPFELLKTTIEILNVYRHRFIKTENKKYWWQMIQILPSSYNQKRTVMLNYEVLKNMYHSRKNHKLDEWRTFCDFIKELPYAKELICNE